MTIPDPKVKWTPLIRAMLEGAVNPSTPSGEAEAFMAKAMELMAKYGIDEALVRGTDPAADPIVHDEYVFDVVYARQFINSLGVLAKVMGCQAVTSDVVVNGVKKSGAYKLHLFGRRSVIDRLKFLYPSLVMQCLTGLAVACRGREGDKTFKRAFILGFGNKVTARMVELSAAQKATLNSGQASRYALVLRSDADKAQTLLKQVFPRTRATVSRYTDRSAFGAGITAGARADLGQARMGGGRLAIGT